MPTAKPLLRSSDWIESYIIALQSTGLSGEYSAQGEEPPVPAASMPRPLTQSESATSDDDTSVHHRVARFYVGQVRLGNSSPLLSLHLASLSRTPP
jgi:hypothetical protein